MNKVEALCCRALIGHLEYCNMNKDEWIEWASLHWKSLIDYIPTISLLPNKWLFFVFLEKKGRIAHFEHIVDHPERIPSTESVALQF